MRYPLGRQANPSPLQIVQRRDRLPKQPRQRSNSGFPSLSRPVTIRPEPPQISQGARPVPLQRWHRRFTYCFSFLRGPGCSISVPVVALISENCDGSMNSTFASYLCHFRRRAARSNRCRRNLAHGLYRIRKPNDHTGSSKYKFTSA